MFRDLNLRLVKQFFGGADDGSFSPGMGGVVDSPGTGVCLGGVGDFHLEKVIRDGDLWLGVEERLQRGGGGEVGAVVMGVDEVIGDRDD